ncbi:hypothetical protein Clacol_009279 [Clathrus columnatus]|uniref:Mug135-like C-terminal domain-containing protein n=1 Tax=Clathrus columnatus TaxID=1419009 RepID=A0AAV5AMJ3_9AGAM|nr:hypothetical protein Clacol_009279 [Clathrus columnatus]
MPIVELRDFPTVEAPGAHGNPATIGDINAAIEYNELETLDGLQATLAQLRGEVQAVRGEVQVVRGEMQAGIDSVREIAIQTAITTAQILNRGRLGGRVVPLIPVRYPSGRFPEADRPPLTNLATINGLDFQIVRSYTQSYGLVLPLGADVNAHQRALAIHVGATV